ncbi:MAG: transposase zinc-binding domain-containing protein [Myxococcota bacterium]
MHEAFRRGWPSVSSLLPKRIQAEAARFLTCGDARFGFVEVACASCDDARLVAFSCKGRGWCPSCTTRRALDTGAHLESALPRVAHRQWTLSLPMALRFHVVKRPALLKRLEVRLVRAVWRLQRATSRRLGHEGTLTGPASSSWASPSPPTSCPGPPPRLSWRSTGSPPRPPSSTTRPSRHRCARRPESRLQPAMHAYPRDTSPCFTSPRAALLSPPGGFPV